MAAQSWPPLPEKGFVAGRPATEKDVTDGNAIFVAKRDDVQIGAPLAILIPQYAYLLEAADKNRKTPVIIVQAEQANGKKLFGARDLDGKEYVAMEQDIQLLGLKP